MKNKEATHKKFKRGQMVSVYWHKNWYRGKYSGWDNVNKEHAIKFPVYTMMGTKLEMLFVKDSKNKLFATQMLTQIPL